MRPDLPYTFAQGLVALDGDLLARYLLLPQPLKAQVAAEAGLTHTQASALVVSMNVE